MSRERQREEDLGIDPSITAESESYRGLMDELAAAGDDREPSFGWQSRVRAAIAERARARHARRRRIVVYFSSAALAASILAVLTLRSPDLPRAASLTVAVVAGSGAPRRGDEAKPGDVLHLEAEAGGAEHAELRVYRGTGELVLRCSSEAPCKRGEDHLEASLALLAMGTYQALLVTAPGPLPEPAGDLNRDTERVSAAGGAVRLAPPIDVR